MIYESKVNAERNPVAPDETAVKYFDKQREYTLDKIEKGLVKANEEHIKTTFTQAELMMNSNITNAYKLYPSDTASYEETVKKGNDKIMESLPDGQEKVNLAAKMGIYAQNKSFDTKINDIKQKDDQRTETIRTKVDQDVEDLIDQSHYYFSQIDNPDKMMELHMKETDIMEALELKNINGMNVITEADRRKYQNIKDNILYTGLTTWAVQNVKSNPSAVSNQLAYLKNNKAEAMKKFGNDEGSYQEAINDLSRLIKSPSSSKGKKTSDPVVVEQDARQRLVTDQAIAVIYDKKTDTIYEDYNNPLDLIDVKNKINATKYSTKPSQGSADKAEYAIDRALVESIRNNPQIEKKGMFWDRTPKTAGDQVIDTIENVYLGGKGKKRKEVIDDPYVVNEYANILSVVYGLADKQGIDMDSKNPNDIKEINKLTAYAITEVAQAAYPKEYMAVIAEMKWKDYPQIYIAEEARRRSIATATEKKVTAILGVKKLGTITK